LASLADPVGKDPLDAERPAVNNPLNQRRIPALAGEPAIAT
jgi:hypothetical protein